MVDDPKQPMTVDSLLEAARARIQRATPAEAQRAIREGALIIDLRCPGERKRTGMIPGSVAIARSVLEWRADPASPSRDDKLARPDARMLLLCEQGYSSSLAAASLRDLSFNHVGDIVGGMERWLAEGRPVDLVDDT